jgi:ectoine hydroxylase-related dioxygenase (phytanoyl-CoA dioxygenase family)
MDPLTLRAILPGVPLVESPFFEETLESYGFDADTSRIAQDLHKNGYAIFDFPDEEIEARADRIKRNLQSQFSADWLEKTGNRLENAWTFDADVRAIATNGKLIKILSDVFGRKAFPFQTLNFPLGSQQEFHSDSVHFSSIPERFMCGVWVALEDISEDAGPLEYYPGSHKWPIIYNDQIGARMFGTGRPPPYASYQNFWRAMIEKSKIAPQFFCPRKGQAIIWLANLLHGGSRQRDPGLTRWSQVTHYYFKNCCYITPTYSDIPVGKLAVRQMIDISTCTPVPNVYVDIELSELAPVGTRSKWRPSIPWIRRLKLRRRVPRDFDPDTYVKINPDVAVLRMDPFEHYLLYGQQRRYR